MYLREPSLTTQPRRFAWPRGSDTIPKESIISLQPSPPHGLGSCSQTRGFLSRYCKPQSLQSGRFPELHGEARTGKGSNLSPTWHATPLLNTGRSAGTRTRPASTWQATDRWRRLLSSPTTKSSLITITQLRVPWGDKARTRCSTRRSLASTNLVRTSRRSPPQAVATAHSFAESHARLPSLAAPAKAGACWLCCPCQAARTMNHSDPFGGFC